MPEVVVDAIYCIGCKSCEIACAVEHSLSKNLITALFEPTPARKRIFVCAAAGQNIPLNCRHCEDAPCVRACPTGALYWEDELVLHARERCLGCGACQMACPFGVITRLPNSKIIAKCDRCPDRVIPACVDACPTGALRFGDPAVLENTRRRQLAEKLV
ncbi:MAG: 4Fe-4S dicluster domain-containing protein [Peptococcaceae bacterium]|nr:4Fe-4S dicluster domain-containing protein [Peptococcaceae bacterium]